MDKKLHNEEKDEKKETVEQDIKPEMDWLNRVKKISSEKKEKMMIILLLGVFLLLVANPLSSNSEEQKEENKEDNTVETDYVSEENEKNSQKDEYITQLENKLEQTIEGMEGAGKVIVMITLKDSGEKILDKNQAYESNTEKSKEEAQEREQSTMKSNPETVLIEEDGNTKPIIIQEIYPDIEGVVVVCEGGGNTELSLRIKEAVQALFSVEAHKIVVCKLQK